MKTRNAIPDEFAWHGVQSLEVMILDSMVVGFMGDLSHDLFKFIINLWRIGPVSKSQYRASSVLF
jgi:hypothetical protein